MKLQLQKLAIALTILTASSIVLAATTTTADMTSSATLNATCHVSSDPLSFGTFTTTTHEVEGTTTMKLRCSKGIVASIEINGGNSGDYFNRYMVGASGNTDKLKYNIYSSQNQVWGEGGSMAYNNDYSNEYETGAEQLIPIVGKIEASQYIKPDTYNDLLTITINY